MVYEVEEKDTKEFESYLKEKSLHYIAYDNAQKLMLHHGLIRRHDELVDYCPEKGMLIKTDIKQAVENTYDNNQKEIDDYYKEATDSHISFEYYAGI